MIDQQNDMTIDLIRRWANSNPNIQAVLLTSSRAGNHGEIDFLSDYDIEVFVSDTTPFLESDHWLAYFGEPMTWWPFKPGATFDEQWITRLVAFTNGIRIDFQITSELNTRPAFSDYGYEILVDKKNLLADLPDATYSIYNPKPPTESEFETLVSDFWWDAGYVPKYLWRGELPYAGFMMEVQVKHRFLHTIIEWYIGVTRNWKVNTGAHGKYFEKYLESELWEMYKRCFADADPENFWRAFYAAIDLFSRLAKFIGKELGYNYPEDRERKIREFYDVIRKHD